MIELSQYLHGRKGGGGGGESQTTCHIRNIYLRS